MDHISDFLLNTYQNLKNRKRDLDIIKNETEKELGFSLEDNKISFKKGILVLNIKTGPKKTEAFIKKDSILKTLSEKNIKISKIDIR